MEPIISRTSIRPTCEHDAKYALPAFNNNDAPVNKRIMVRSSVTEILSSTALSTVGIKNSCVRLSKIDVTTIIRQNPITLRRFFHASGIIKSIRTFSFKKSNYIIRIYSHCMMLQG